ncbi:UNVERIFIED_CONTAM: hypothetical protein PYX00_002183 [Menopon gallinae]|uniref:thioredoxin-dependent peroxiredoxin n=1 Tax=Menopon gallinae TaxID=328185 RepID=A0AAW2IGA9_9NEOP
MITLLNDINRTECKIIDHHAIRTDKTRRFWHLAVRELSLCWRACAAVYLSFTSHSFQLSKMCIPASRFILITTILLFFTTWTATESAKEVRGTADKQWTKAIIQRKAPYWKGIAVINGEFKELHNTDFYGKYLVLIFYPLDFTFVCPTEILAFNDRLPEFKELNADVVVCSVDSHYTHLAWTNTSRKDGGLGNIQLPMLSDITRTISQDYGVYVPDLGHSLRGLFIIDAQGNLRQSTINDLPVGRSVDETLRLLQAFQYTDAHGEVCPANWKPGADTIIPHPVKKRTYFQKVNEDCSGNPH